MMITPEERTLDWRPFHDPRSRDYPIRTLLAQQSRVPRSYTWPCRLVLDQGREGACVGFAWAHELAASPRVVPVSDVDAHQLYRYAQTVDEWLGEAYSGTSVLAGAKAVQARGYMSEYRWAFGLQDVVDTVGAYGPVVLGIPWTAGMYRPQPDGWVYPTGEVVGGHAIMARGVSLRERYVVLHNSWGPGWGRGGTARIPFEALGELLAAQGEACVPVRR